ncbi:MAG TPA: hypothetical protein DCQ83_03365 [Fibrobacteres bacterium]|jgi:hypothetical protein|nr:hypothetical protein [Fibrobacterota bacterium]
MPLLAQTYDFVGLVQDGERGEPIGGAELRTPDGKKLGTSQSTGRFEVQVNNRRAHVIFRKQGYKDLDVDLGELPELIDVEISMESSVQELAEVTAFTKRPAHDPNQAQSMEELEALQGMRIDLNDHLRQLHGVAGMNEFTNDISVNGSRTQDVTHYLGHSRIPSLRHLDFGFPGNQSVLNPRVLKSVTLSDNQAKGPVNQGNASALVYDLQDGDPEAIHGDFVYGSVDRELNLNGYWDGRTYLVSGRLLDDNSLGNLGSKFFTTPKDARIGQSGGCKDSTVTCAGLKDPLSFTSGDLFIGTFKRDSTGAFSRHSLVVLGDDFKVQEDVGATLEDAEARALVKGHQGAWLYSYESVTPSSSGDWEWGFSTLFRDYQDAFHDTMTTTNVPDWYQYGINSTNQVDYQLGDNKRTDWQAIWSVQYSPASKTFGAQPSYGVELEYHHQNRGFYDLPVDYNNLQTIKLDAGLATILYRLRWNLPKKKGLDLSLGVAGGYDAPFAGDKPEILKPLPLASLRYTHPLGDDNKLFAEAAVRQSTDFEPVGYNTVHTKSTQSGEVLFGGDGAPLNSLRYAWSGYTRWYLDPLLPVPDVFWNYAETRSSDYARVSGGNATLNWLPSHHVGLGINGSAIQGAYHMKDGGTLPWESNRTMDVVTNIRFLPRSDSLFSFILTYTVSNDRPLYEYRGLWDTTGTDHPTEQVAVYQSTTFPEVSRKRVDVRINMDLKSHWRPLESMRFFFEADNIFANYEGTLGGWLGGNNRRQRGWTRPGDANGDLQPVVTRGLGFFIMFGVEGRLKI